MKISDKFLVLAIFKGKDIVVNSLHDDEGEAENVIRNHAFKGQAPLYVLPVKEYRGEIING